MSDLEDDEDGPCPSCEDGCERCDPRFLSTGPAEGEGANEGDLARAISRVDWIRKTNTGNNITVTPAEQDAIRLLITDVEDRYWPAPPDRVAEGAR